MDLWRKELLSEENVKIKVPLTFTVICLIGDYESQFEEKVANITHREMIYWLGSPPFLWSPTPVPPPSLDPFLWKYCGQTAKFPADFAAPPKGRKRHPGDCRSQQRLVSQSLHQPSPKLPSEALLNCESVSIFPILATTKVLPSSHFSALGSSPSEQPAPIPSSTRGSRPGGAGRRPP